MPRGPLRLDHLGGGEIRAADVAHLAGAHEIVERAQRLLDRGERVGPVDLVEVEPVGLQPLQARLDGGHDVAARAAFLFAVVHRHAEFRGKHDVLAPVAQHLAEHGLRAAAPAIDVGRIEQRDPGVERLVDDQASSFRGPSAGRNCCSRGRPARRAGRIFPNSAVSCSCPMHCRSATLACAQSGGNPPGRASARRSHAALALAPNVLLLRMVPGQRPAKKKRRSRAPTRGKRNAPSAPRGRAVHRPENRLEPGRPRAQPGDHRVRRGGALSHAARHRPRPSRRGAEGDRDAGHRARRVVRRGRLFHAHLLRPVRAAHDRREPRALPRRGDRRLHQLFGRPQSRRHACSPAARCATASIRPGG